MPARFTIPVPEAPRAIIRAAGVSAVALALLSGGAAAALPETVDPSLCTVAPLTEDALVAAAASPVPSSTPSAPADGAVPAEAMDGIERTIRLSVACTNANQPMRNFALFTERFLAERFGGEQADDLGHLLAALSREPSVAAPADRLTLVAISDPRPRADGAVSVTVETANATARFLDEITLVETGGAWLIDRVEPGEVMPGTPSAGSPVRSVE